MKKISVLIPAYNEQDSIEHLYTALKDAFQNLPDYLWEAVFINDGSSDNTLDILQTLHKKDSRISYVDLSRNFGKECAMMAGFDFVTGDCVIIMDADLQHPPYVIPEMVKKWEEGYEDVYARRLSRGKESFFRKKLSLLFYKILQKTSKIEILPNVGDFRLLDRRCIVALRGLRESERYTKGLFCWIGYRKTYIDFVQGDRLYGKSSWGFGGLFSLALEGILSYTIFPLRIATFVGLFVSFTSILYMFYIFIKTLIYGEIVSGFPTLVILILFLGGMQLFALGIVGEYLGRVYNETKRRPVYIAREYNGTLI